MTLPTTDNYSGTCFCAVLSGESAHEAEVQVGDTVAKVNDTDVRRANAELVQSLIS